MLGMLRRQVLPAAQRYQTELAQLVAATATAGREDAAAARQLTDLMGIIGRLRAAGDEIERALTPPVGDAERHARQIRAQLVPAMERARAASDALEELIPTGLWPLPTYAEMLFQR